MPASEALKLAQEKQLDLIEVAPNAKPPVVRIMKFDKFRYEKEKEIKKQRLSQKSQELKHVRISPRAASHDLNTKVNQLEKFLNEGHKVEVDLFLRGREKGHKDWGLKKLNEFLSTIKTPYQVTLPPKSAGRGYITQIIKK